MLASELCQLSIRAFSHRRHTVKPTQTISVGAFFGLDAPTCYALTLRTHTRSTTTIGHNAGQ